MTNKKVYYWDACVFIHWLHADLSQTEMDGIQSIVNCIDSKKGILITSVIIFVELLLSSLKTKEQKRAFQDIFKRSNVKSISVDKNIAQKAHERIIHYRQKGTQIISSLDALHLATAIIYEANEFHTFDGERHGDKKNVPILSLNGDVAGYNLIIKKPCLDMGIFEKVEKNEIK